MIVRNSNGVVVVDVFDFGESGDDVGENGSVGKEQGGDCQTGAAQLRRGVVGGCGWWFSGGFFGLLAGRTGGGGVVLRLINCLNNY